MKAKHTPGPWQLTRLDVDTSVTGPDGQLVVGAEFDGWMAPFTGREEGLANAHLIAAAPEMLEALKLVLPTLSTEAAKRVVTDAIAKARGES